MLDHMRIGSAGRLLTLTNSICPNLQVGAFRSALSSLVLYFFSNNKVPSLRISGCSVSASFARSHGRNTSNRT